MENTAKALAIQNKWLFTEIESDELILKFMNNDDSSFRRLFQYAKKESMDQKATYLIVIKNIEQLLESQSENNGMYSNIVE
jgi:ATP-dependent 26S proteasome regulatory subunit